MAIVSTMSAGAANAIAQMPNALWRANEMATCRTSTLPSGFTALDGELPNAGWPKSTLIELLLQQAGIGELQLLKPTLSTLARSQRIALIQPPHLPHGAAFHGWGLRPESLFWMKAKSTADALWSAEQILKNGSCGALILWQNNIRTEALRRLNLAAQSGDTVFWLIRPISARQDTSPAPLRLALRPAFGGVSVDIVKRRGPTSEETLYIPLPDMPTTRHIQEIEHAPMDQRAPAIAAARSIPTLLV
ncbi:translesion DNA synthesis-associated protein ImuA [Glaciimonas soli]|nr:translesion DNA synthesis-associated protein ImuA [Glaciimonas soli]